MEMEIQPQQQKNCVDLRNVYGGDKNPQNLQDI